MIKTKTVKNMLSLALVVLSFMLLFTLTACGGDEQPVQPSQAPAVTDDAAAQATQAPVQEEPQLPADTPVPTADAEGKLTFTSMSKGFTFQYDQKYIAVANPADNAMVYVTGEMEPPFCSVSIISGSTAADYLKSIAEGSVIELEGDMKAPAGEPTKLDYGDRNIYYIYYTYEDKEAGGNVLCVYYAEDLASGDIAVYNSTALEGATEEADAILTMAIETFKMN